MTFKVLGPNQMEVTFNHPVLLTVGVVMFISYETPVAAFVEGEGIWREDESSSRTTAKHLNRWIAKRFANSTQTQKPRSEIAGLLP